MKSRILNAYIAAFLSGIIVGAFGYWGWDSQEAASPRQDDIVSASLI
jgi:hypothetical protein